MQKHSIAIKVVIILLASGVAILSSIGFNALCRVYATKVLIQSLANLHMYPHFVAPTLLSITRLINELTE